MAFSDNIGPRTKAAWDAITDLLGDGHWHSHLELVEAATLASDLTPKSIDELIRKGYRTRHYTRRKPTTLDDAIYRRADLDSMAGVR